MYKKVLICCLMLFQAFALHSKEMNYETVCREGTELLSELIQKLSDNTPFTLDDEKYFFGNFDTLNMPLYIYNQLDYVAGDGKLLKELPKYSFYGELLRINRNLFSNEGFNLSYLASKRYAYHKNKRSFEDVNHWITVMAGYTEKKMNPIDYEDEKIISMTYNGISKSLIAPIRINGKSIMKDLGFHYEGYGKKNGFTDETLKILKKHISELENN